MVVTATRSAFTRTVTNGTKYTVTTVETTGHGPYFRVEKAESVDDGTNNGVSGKVRNVSYTSG
ncbi:hypothetical protein [Streptomyces sp. NPDC006510]|uniref:hypothetical protein n=1 Tax=Streptomyces sp. NPDC006510 TaxID=3155600 RepID=UPI0033A221BF